MHEEILIVGGYGQVGRVVADRLGRLFPGRVIVAGRNLEQAEAFARRTGGRVRPRRLDVTELHEPAAALGNAQIVVMCVDQPDAFGRLLDTFINRIEKAELQEDPDMHDMLVSLHQMAEGHVAISHLWLIPKEMATPAVWARKDRLLEECAAAGSLRRRTFFSMVSSSRRAEVRGKYYHGCVGAAAG